MKNQIVNTIVVLVTFATSLFAGNRALYFPSGEHSATTEAIASSKIGSRFTIEFWVNPADLSEQKGIIGQWGNSSDDQSWLMSVKDGEICLEVKKKGSTVPNMFGQASIDTEEWNHVAISFNGSQIAFYLNGESRGKGTVSSSISPQSITEPIILGVRDGDGWFEGAIDDVRVWNTVRTESQISDNYKKSLTTASGLVLNWTFDDDSAKDLAGNYSLTLNGAVFADGTTFKDGDHADPSSNSGSTGGGGGTGTGGTLDSLSLSSLVDYLVANNLVSSSRSTELKAIISGGSSGITPGIGNNLDDTALVDLMVSLAVISSDRATTLKGNLGGTSTGGVTTSPAELKDFSLNQSTKVATFWYDATPGEVVGFRSGASFGPQFENTLSGAVALEGPTDGSSVQVCVIVTPPAGQSVPAKFFQAVRVKKE